MRGPNPPARLAPTGQAARRTARLALTLVVGVAALIGVCGALSASGLRPSPAGAAAAPPFSDPAADGYIGLCNQSGQQITTGSITTTPFAWRAVSSVAAPAPYNNAGRTAILLAYQPQPGLEPGEWSGDELTASSRYSNPAHPMVAATTGDDSLADFLQEFQPKWDGFLELRIYLGTQNAEPYSVHYPALDIEVSGSTWTAVGGGTVDCQSGTAESLESIVLPSTTTTTSSARTGADGSSHGQAPTGEPTTTHAPVAGATAGTPPGAHPEASGPTLRANRTSSGWALVWLPIAAVVIALAAAGALLLARRRRTVDFHPATAQLSQKGDIQ